MLYASDEQHTTVYTSVHPGGDVSSSNSAIIDRKRQGMQVGTDRSVRQHSRKDNLDERVFDPPQVV